MLDELKLKYKETSLAKRLAICAFLAILPGILRFSDESPIIEEEFARAETEEKTAADRLIQADNQLKNLQKTENDLEFTREQLKKAETRLPDVINIDEILRTVGKSARDFEIGVRLFEPQSEVVKGDEYKFAELPLKIHVEAKDYSQLCEWLDSFAGLKSKVYLKSWNLKRRIASVAANGSDSPEGRVEGSSQLLNSSSMLAEQSGRDARDRMRLVVEGEFALYKLASSVKITAPDSTAPQPETAAPNGKPSADGASIQTTPSVFNTLGQSSSLEQKRGAL